MAIPKISKTDVLDALKYIDENGVPTQHSSVKYELVTEEVYFCSHFLQSKGVKCL